MNFSLFSVLFSSIIQGEESRQGGKENTSNNDFYRILEGIGENVSIPLFNSGIPGSIIYSGDENKEVLNKDSHNQYKQFIKVSPTNNQDYSIRLNPSELIHNLIKINNYDEENHLIKELFTNRYIFDNTDIDLDDEEGIILSIKLPDFLKNNLLEKINSIIINKENFEKNNFLFEASDNTVGIPISIPISQSKNYKINAEKKENNAINQVYLKFCIKDFLNLNKDITGKDSPLTVILDDISLTNNNNIQKYAKIGDRQECQSYSLLNKIIGSDEEYAKSVFSDSNEYFGEGYLKISDLKSFENEKVAIPLQLEVEKDYNVSSFLFFSDFDNIKDEFENKKSIPIKVFLKSKEDFIKTNLDEKILDGYVKFNGSVKDEIFSDLKVEDKKTDLLDNVNKEVDGFQDKLDDKPVTHENINGNLFINLIKIENIDSEDFELPIINPFYADKKISIIIPKDSLTILKDSNLEKVNKEKIDIPILIREIQNYSDNNADEEAIRIENFNNINYNTTDKTKNDEYLSERKYYNELVKSEILQLNVFFREM